MKNILLFLLAFALISTARSQVNATNQEAVDEQEIIDKYSHNSLPDGSTPYSACFGTNTKCSEYGCSEIRVKTPSNSDVLVTIKTDGKVVRHAYIKAGSSYTFEIPNGTYQTFFYYGKGWYPDKLMKSIPGCELKGGFVSDEYFGKDDPQKLDNIIVEYELVLQQNGNFMTKPSEASEIF